MTVQENATEQKPPTAAQDEYIAFLALGGIVPDENNPAGRRMRLEELAERLDVNPSTLWRWRKTIPNFWELVAAKRKELSGKDRLTNVWNGLYLKAVAGNADAAKLYLANFDPNFKMPTQKVEHEAGDSWVELLRGKDRKVIEGQKVNETD